MPGSQPVKPAISLRARFTALSYRTGPGHSISGLHKLFREEHGNLYKKRAKKFYI